MEGSTASSAEMALAYISQINGLNEAIRTLDSAMRDKQFNLTEAQVNQRIALLQLSKQLIQAKRDNVMGLMTHYWITHEQEVRDGRVR